MNKYYELYIFSKEALYEEFNRFSRADEQASKFIGILTFLIGLYGYFSKNLLEKLFPLDKCLGTLIIVVMGIEFFLLLVSWFKLFGALRQFTLRKPTINDEFIKFYKENKLVTILYALSKRNSEAFNKCKKVTDKKYKMLREGYNFLYFALMGIIIIVVLFSIHVFQ